MPQANPGSRYRCGKGLRRGIKSARRHVFRSLAASLITEGVPVDAADEDAVGATPLMHAAAGGHLGC